MTSKTEQVKKKMASLNEGGDDRSCDTDSTDAISGTENSEADLDVFTGTNDLKDAGDLNDFIWVMNDEPHSSRRKEMLKKHPEVKKLMGHEPLTKYIVTALLCLQLGMAYHLREDALWGGTFKFWLCAYVVGGTVSQALFLACHEISHNLAFRKFSHNRLFGIFTNIPLLVPFFMYFKYYHNEHHKYQGVDGIDTDIPTRVEAKFLSNWFGKLFFLTFQIWFYAIRPVMVKTPKITVWHGLNYAVQIAFVSATVYFVGWGPIIYLVASGHFAGSLHPMASHFIAEHYVFQGEEETYSYYGPLNWFAWNVGYHNEHHDFPTVPWSRLPALYALMKEDYYGKMPYHKSWVKVMYKFLMMPSISLYNRVKRPDKENLLKKDISGDAEYTGDWLLGTGWSKEAKVVKAKKIN